MDEPSVAESHLQESLANLRWVNHLLGGFAATRRVLEPTVRSHRSLEILDVGTGRADYLTDIAKMGVKMQTCIRGVGLDINPTVVGYARAQLDRSLPLRLRPHFHVEIGNALSLPYPDDAFDVTHAALFLHHLHGNDTVRMLCEMDRVSRLGIVVNDLHRHWLAYVGIWGLTRILSFSPMVRHDGPASVRRGFARGELESVARCAELTSPSVQWHWAFRWTLSTLPSTYDPPVR